MEATKERVELEFNRSGERERIKDILLTKLRDSGWTVEVKKLCKDYIKQRGIENVSVEDVYQEIRGNARKAVPDDIKRDMLVLVRNFVKEQTKIDDL